MTTNNIQQKSVPIMARISPDLNDRVEALVKERSYESKSDFLRAAAQFYVEFCETVNLDEIQQQATDQFYAQRRHDLLAEAA